MSHLLIDWNIVPEMELRWPTVLEMEGLSRHLVYNRDNGAPPKGIYSVVDDGRFCCGE